IQEHNLDQDILDFGTPDQNILIQLYNAADILLAPSLYEGYRQSGEGKKFPITNYQLPIPYEDFNLCLRLRTRYGF
ncbi:MAG: hypothetical protein ACKPJ4_04225, partial [Dolichospermum sp.]